MHVDGTLVDIDVVAPNAVEQLLARVDTAGVAHQVLEQPVLGGAQVDLTTTATDAVAGAVELKVAGLEHGGNELRAGTAQQRVDAGEQLGDRERLHHIVVGPGGEAA